MISVYVVSFFKIDFREIQHILHTQLHIHIQGAPKESIFLKFQVFDCKSHFGPFWYRAVQNGPNDLKRAIAVQKVHNLPKLSKMIQIVQNLKIHKFTCFGDTLYSALTYNTHLVIPDLWNHCGLKKHKMPPVLHTHLVACTRDTLYLEWELEQQVGVVCLVHLRLCVYVCICLCLCICHLSTLRILGPMLCHLKPVICEISSNPKPQRIISETLHANN